MTTYGTDYVIVRGVSWLFERVDMGPQYLTGVKDRFLTWLAPDGALHSATWDAHTFQVPPVDPNLLEPWAQGRTRPGHSVYWPDGKVGVVWFDEVPTITAENLLPQMVQTLKELECQ